MTAREKIGQRLVAGFPGTVVDQELEELIKVYKIANIILFKHNVESDSQLRALCSHLRTLIKEHTGQEAMITIDQEGGMVTRLLEDNANIPGAMAIAATGDPQNAYEAGKITAKQLRDCLIDFNLAPDLDVNSNSENPVIGVRSYGDDPQKVADYGAAMIRGLLDGGVLASAKHFPGHGDTSVDSHLGLPQINKSLEELYSCELVPFIRAIEEKVPAITTTHILFPQLEETLPATMSRNIMTGLLREKLGFQGLIISDCMEMQAIQKFYGTVEGVKKAIQAGVDLVFISHTASLVREASDVLTKALESGELKEQEMEESIARIARYRGYGVKKQTEPAFDTKKGIDFAYHLLKKTITPIQMPGEKLPMLGSEPLFVGPLPFRATNASSAEGNQLQFPGYMKAHFGGTAILMSANPEQEEIDKIAAAAKKASCVVIGTYNGHLYKGQLAAVEKAAKAAQSVIVLALRNPYDLRNLPKHVYSFAVYEYTKKSFEAVIELLEGRLNASGVLPVSLT